MATKEIGRGIGYNIGTDRDIPPEMYDKFFSRFTRDLKSSQTQEGFYGTSPKKPLPNGGVQGTVMLLDKGDNLSQVPQVVSSFVGASGQHSPQITQIPFRLYGGSETIHGKDAQEVFKKSLEAQGGQIESIVDDVIKYTLPVDEAEVLKQKKQKHSPTKRLEDMLFREARLMSMTNVQRESDEQVVKERLETEKLNEKYGEKYTSKHKKYSDLVKDKDTLTPEELLDRYKNIERKDKEEVEEKAKSKETKRRIMGGVKAVVGTLLLIADITRRILTSVLNLTSKARADSAEAQTYGMTYQQVRESNAFDKYFGLKEGTTTKAIADLQSKFGDITNLDEKALGTLARVMGADVQKMVYSGIGGDEPDKLLESILNKFFASYKSGKNSIGQYVGQEQALRELTTVLRGISPEIASIFSVMANEWATGTNAGLFSDYTSMKNLPQSNRGGMTDVELSAFVALGAEANRLHNTFDQLRKLIEGKFSLALGGVISKINDWRIGESADEKQKHDKRNRELLEISKREDEEARNLSKTYLEGTLKSSTYSDLAEGLTIDDILKYATMSTQASQYLVGEQADKYRKVNSLMARMSNDPNAIAFLAQYQTTGQRLEETNKQLSKSGDFKYTATEHTAEGKALKDREAIQELTKKRTYSYQGQQYISGSDLFAQIAQATYGGEFSLSSIPEASREQLRSAYISYQKTGDNPFFVGDELSDKLTKDVSFGNYSNPFLKAFASSYNKLVKDPSKKMEVSKYLGNVTQSGVDTLLATKKEIERVKTLYKDNEAGYKTTEAYKLEQAIAQAELEAFGSTLSSGKGDQKKAITNAIQSNIDTIQKNAENTAKTSYGRTKVGAVESALREAYETLQDTDYSGSTVNLVRQMVQGSNEVHLVVTLEDGKKTKKTIDAGTLHLSAGSSVTQNLKSTFDISELESLYNSGGM